MHLTEGYVEGLVGQYPLPSHLTEGDVHGLVVQYLGYRLT